MTPNASDEVGSQTLQHIERMDRFNRWMSETIAPYLAGEVLEIGCGTGNITRFLIAAGHSVFGLDLRPEYIQYTCKRLSRTARFEGLVADIAHELPPDLRGRQFDTVVMLNVLEHIENEGIALRNAALLCRPGGCFVCLVPAYRWLYGSLDLHLGHCRRYDPQMLSRAVRRVGFHVERCFHFNVAGIPGWWLNGRFLKRTILPPNQLALYDCMVPMFRLLERMVAGRAGQSLVVVARRDDLEERSPA